jgi:hypothetical protein
VVTKRAGAVHREPAIEGSGVDSLPGQRRTIKASEF